MVEVICIASKCGGGAGLGGRSSLGRKDLGWVGRVLELCCSLVGFKSAVLDVFHTETKVGNGTKPRNMQNASVQTIELS